MSERTFLEEIHLKNIGVITQANLEFDKGLTVLTGETGAGKSIILDALDAALGGKITTKLMRTGSDRAVIEAVFTANPILIDWLSAQEIDLIEENQIICSQQFFMDLYGMMTI